VITGCTRTRVGEPPSLEALGSRYARQVAGQSDDGSRGWLNWIIRESGTRLAVETVQATISAEQSSMSAELAWVLGVAHQGRGYATEAISAIVAWLRRHAVDTFAAHIRSGHEASEGVARRVGLDTGLADARRGHGLRCSTLAGNSDAVGSRASFL